MASDPAGTGPRVIVFQCTADGVGPLLAGFRNVKLDVDDLQQLVKDFHRQTGFVPGLPAFSPWIAEEAISRRTRALHAALNRCALSKACVVERASEDRIVWQGSATERVFLCHSSGDKSLVRALYEQLRRDGFDPWLDEKDLLGGQEWETEIQNAIRRSGAVIVCLSKASLTRTGFVQKEIKIALDALDERPEGQVFVIPIRLEPCDIPGRLKAFHCLDCFDEAGYQLLRRSIRGALRGDTLRRDLAV